MNHPVYIYIYIYIYIYKNIYIPTLWLYPFELMTPFLRYNVIYANLNICA